jgi:putative membrane protein
VTDPGTPVALVTPHEPRQRLHPLSPLLHGAKSLVVIVAALSWQTLSQVGLGRFALTVAVLAVGAVVLAVVSWLNTGYHVVGRELRVHEGLLWRRTRAIPLERLQAVEVVRPLLAQLTGLAELRLEVVGGAKTEAPLAYLTVGDAAALRERLLAVAGHAGHPATDGADRPAPIAGRALHAVRNRDLLIGQLLTPQAFFLPFGVTFVAVQAFTQGSWSLITIASTVTAMAGVVLQPVRRVLQDWNFRVARDDEGRLRLAYGLVETRNQAVPLNRVQAVGVTWPLLWRAKRWLHLRLDVAGFAGPEPGGGTRSDRLLPVGDLATARALLAEVLPGVDLVALPLTAPPPRARWVHPVARAAFGAGLTDEVFVTRSGRLTRRIVVAPYARIQSVRVVQGPLQRRLRLATVYADTAGGLPSVARDRDVAEAWALAAELTTRAGRARAAGAFPAAPPTPPGSPAPQSQPTQHDLPTQHGPPAQQGAAAGGGPPVHDEPSTPSAPPAPVVPDDGPPRPSGGTGGGTGSEPPGNG